MNPALQERSSEAGSGLAFQHRISGAHFACRPDYPNRAIESRRVSTLDFQQDSQGCAKDGSLHWRRPVLEQPLQLTYFPDSPAWRRAYPTGDAYPFDEHAAGRRGAGVPLRVMTGTAIARIFGEAHSFRTVQAGRLP